MTGGDRQPPNYTAFMRSRFPAILLFSALILGASVMASGQKASLPFVEDDYAQVLAQARTQNLPLFVEIWAPW